MNNAILSIKRKSIVQNGGPCCTSPGTGKPSSSSSGRGCSTTTTASTSTKRRRTPSKRRWRTSHFGGLFNFCFTPVSYTCSCTSYSRGSFKSVFSSSHALLLACSFVALRAIFSLPPSLFYALLLNVRPSLLCGHVYNSCCALAWRAI